MMGIKMLYLLATILMTITLGFQTPVRALENASQKWLWHNIEITIKKPMDAEKPDEVTASIEDYKRVSKGGKVITTHEAQKVFGAPLYRPVPFKIPLVASNGLYQQFFTLKEGKMGDPVLKFAHWDIFQKGGEWAVVIQDIDTFTRDLLNRKETVRDAYPWYMKVLQVPGSDNVALLTPFANSEMKRLSVQILDPQGKVIRLQIIGNLSEQDLISLASGYKSP